MESGSASMNTPLLADLEFRYEDAEEDVDILLRGYVDSVESPPSYSLLSGYLEGESQHDSSPDEEICLTRQHRRQYIKGQVQSLIGSLLSFRSSSSTSRNVNDSIIDGSESPRCVGQWEGFTFNRAPSYSFSDYSLVGGCERTTSQLTSEEPLLAKNSISEENIGDGVECHTVDPKELDMGDEHALSLAMIHLPMIPRMWLRLESYLSME